MRAYFQEKLRWLNAIAPNNRIALLMALVVFSLSFVHPVAATGTISRVGSTSYPMQDEASPSETPVPTSTNTPNPTATPTATTVPGQVVLLFSDEFEGSALDAGKWNTCHWWDHEGCTIEGNGEMQWYLPDDVLVSDGVLRLRAQKRKIEVSDGQTYSYTSGMVTTGRNTTDLTVPPKFAFQYGYAEIRAKVPRGQGLWSAFWMVPAENRPFPEIDVMEIIGREFEKNHMVLHYLAEDGTRRSTSRSWSGSDWGSDWHTFGIDWQPSALTWYIDGMPRFKYVGAQIPTEPMVLVANLAVGGTWPGPPDSTTVLPSYLEVDYVKVWSEMPEDALAKEPVATQKLAPTETPAVDASPVPTSPTVTVPSTSTVLPTSTPTLRISPTPTAIPGQSALLFSDEFDGMSLDTKKWTTCYWWRDSSGGCTITANNELQWHQPDDVLVENGTLKLRAQERMATDANGKIYNYTSGMVSTGREVMDDPEPDRFAFQYGYAEIRAKIPNGQGLWPSFWMLAVDQEWPPEIDAVSFTGDRPRVVRFGVQYIDVDTSNGVSSREWEGPNFSRGWHTFAIDWQPSGLTWYVDGIKRWFFNDTALIPDEPLYLVLDLTVGGSWPGDPDSSTEFPSYFEIDYVKVWSEKP